MTAVSSFGALVALIVAIFLILKKVSPVYGMLTGALIGGLVAVSYTHLTLPTKRIV